jgi:hypothetical protein
VKAAQDVRKSNSVDETIEELRNRLHPHVCSGALEAQLFLGSGLKNEMEAFISLYKEKKRQTVPEPCVHDERHGAMCPIGSDLRSQPDSWEEQAARREQSKGEARGARSGRSAWRNYAVASCRARRERGAQHRHARKCWPPRRCQPSSLSTRRTTQTRAPLQHQTAPAPSLLLPAPACPSFFSLLLPPLAFDLTLKRPLPPFPRPPPPPS